MSTRVYVHAPCARTALMPVRVHARSAKIEGESDPPESPSEVYSTALLHTPFTAVYGALVDRGIHTYRKSAP